MRGLNAVLGLKVTPVLVARTLACAVLTTLGFHFISKGKREADLAKMLQGVLLIVAGLFLSF